MDNSLSKRLFATFERATTGDKLSDLCFQLHYGQLATWREYAEAVIQVQCAWYRELMIGDEVVKVQWNPARITNVVAKAEQNDTGDDKCFLCLSLLPPEQRTILYFDSYLILCNPRPIFTPHFTAATVKHLPQEFFSGLPWMLKLACDLSPDFNVFYNGPRCGASIPWHHHFQIYPRGMLSVDRVLEERGECMEVEGVFFSIPSFSDRGAVMIEGDDLSKVRVATERFVKTLACCLNVDGEPMMNVIAAYSDSFWRIVIFPRIKGRPDAFFKDGGERITVSPGAVEMGGMFVTVNEKDFALLDAETVLSLYREISLPVHDVQDVIRGCVKWTYSG